MRPLRAATGKNVATAFEELVLFRWETPNYLLTDNGKEFDNKDLGRILEVYGVIRVTTPPYHPQVENKGPKVRHSPEVWADRVRRLDALRHLVTKNIETAHRQQAEYYSKGRRDVRFQLGDLVMRKAHVMSSGVHVMSSGSFPPNLLLIGRVPLRSSKSSRRMCTC